MRLLYVDDDRINVLLFEEVCRMAGGVEVASAGSGAEALLVAREVRPELLVIDLHLPDTTGFELLRSLRAEPGLAEAPAFLCSADEPGPLQTGAREAGFAGCWSKPVDVQALLAELARLRRPQ